MNEDELERLFDILQAKFLELRRRCDPITKWDELTLLDRPWRRMLKGLGLEFSECRKKGLVCVPDPASIMTYRPVYVVMDEDAALKILALGLP